MLRGELGKWRYLGSSFVCFALASSLLPNLVPGAGWAHKATEATSCGRVSLPVACAGELVCGLPRTLGRDAYVPDCAVSGLGLTR